MASITRQRIKKHLVPQILKRCQQQQQRRYNHSMSFRLHTSRPIIPSISSSSHFLLPTSSSSFTTSTKPQLLPLPQLQNQKKTHRNLAKYTVSKINSRGELKYTEMTLSEILKDSPSIHIRDLFALNLTSQCEVPFLPSVGGKEKESVTVGGEKTDVALFSRKSSLSKRAGSVILPRGEEVVMSIGTVRAVIGKDSAFLLDAHKPSIKVLAEELSEIFTYKMKEALENSTGQNLTLDTQYNVRATYMTEPFELVFIEEILRDACDTFNRRIRLYEPIVDSLLDRVSNEVFSESGVHRLVPIKDSLQEFEMTVKQGLDCLKHLLDNDEDMLGLLLTEGAAARSKGQNLQLKKHESVELLLEEYARQFNGILQEIHYLLQRVQSKQELVALSLDGYRNRMIRMNLYMSIAAVGLATSTTVAGYFGMNLVSGMEESGVAFQYVIVSTTLASLGIFGGSLSYISGSRMKKRAMGRLEEIEAIKGALSDMNALDYAAKSMIQNETPMCRTDFKQKLLEGRKYNNARQLKDDEVDLLFDVLDKNMDGNIYMEDFSAIEQFTYEDI
uniref:Magnesium transporter n=1 Tax=Ditylum brightwellii TaxID=49249 RepID=A0A7S4QR36_9STRA|mmetsp:Transcript_65780/g.97430  ORF Transcript_65780/g.97430 Transcript_65780/m.97430 type:complete len:559 (-) Transcript_65780:36-1712(-)